MIRDHFKEKILVVIKAETVSKVGDKITDENYR